MSQRLPYKSKDMFVPLELGGGGIYPVGSDSKSCS